MKGFNRQALALAPSRWIVNYGRNMGIWNILCHQI